ncbi:hypothetical protein BH11BAC3_BH11BAC3_06020 [soil metagenome]
MAAAQKILNRKAKRPGNLVMNAKLQSIKETHELIKKGIWVYFLLLLFEGALRKWIIPALANPLLLARDPVAVWIIFMAYKNNLMPSNKYLTGMLVIGFVSFLTTMTLGHQNIYVALYGVRILVIHFPLIFIIGRVFTRNDVVKMGKFILLITFPMALLIAMQFYSPQSAWVNRGVGGSLEGAGFSGALGFFRPPATFSFTNGTTLFFGLSGPFIIYFWLNQKGINKIVLLAATLGLIMAIPLSISRALFFQVIITFLFAVIAISRKPENMSKLIIAVIGGSVVLLIMSRLTFFQKATEVFTTRLDGANESEGGLGGVLGDRYLGGMIKSITGSSEQPFFGYGIGTGTSVGGALLSGTGERTLLIYSEDEWARLTGEMGAIMGLGVIFVRIGLSINTAIKSYKKLSTGDLLPWVLLSFFLLTVPQGQWGQPTSLGFSIIIGGLTLASFNSMKTRKKQPGKVKVVTSDNSAEA